MEKTVHISILVLILSLTYQEQFPCGKKNYRSVNKLMFSNHHTEIKYNTNSNSAD